MTWNVGGETIVVAAASAFLSSKAAVGVGLCSAASLVYTVWRLGWAAAATAPAKAPIEMDVSKRMLGCFIPTQQEETSASLGYVKTMEGSQKAGGEPRPANGPGQRESERMAENTRKDGTTDVTMKKEDELRS